MKGGIIKLCCFAGISSQGFLIMYDQKIEWVYLGFLSDSHYEEKREKKRKTRRWPNGWNAEKKRKKWKKANQVFQQRRKIYDDKAKNEQDRKCFPMNSIYRENSEQIWRKLAILLFKILTVIFPLREFCYMYAIWRAPRRRQPKWRFSSDDYSRPLLASRECGFVLGQGIFLLLIGSNGPVRSHFRKSKKGENKRKRRKKGGERG